MASLRDVIYVALSTYILQLGLLKAVKPELFTFSHKAPMQIMASSKIIYNLWFKVGTGRIRFA